MTNLIADGAEYGDGLLFETGGVYISSAIKRSGNYAYGSQSNLGASPTKLLASGLDEFYLRFGSYFDEVGAHTSDIIFFRNGASTAVYIKLDINGHLNFYVGDSLVDTGDHSYTNATWHLLDMHIKVAASGVIELKLNGVPDLYYEGDTRGNGVTYIDRIYWGSGAELGHYPYTYFDDIGLNDILGSVDNSWLGDGHIEILTPNNNGDVNNWTGSDGNKVDNYLLVDDIPPDSDTTYVGAYDGQLQDMYHLSSFDDTNKVVTRIIPEIRARDFSATGQEIKVGYKVGGTVYLPSGYQILQYNYSRIVGENSTEFIPSGLPWTKTELDNIQLVIESGIDVV